MNIFANRFLSLQKENEKLYKYKQKTIDLCSIWERLRYCACPRVHQTSKGSHNWVPTPVPPIGVGQLEVLRRSMARFAP